MKSQKHNTGELAKLEVNIEKNVVEAFEKMAKNTELPIDDLVVVALKRFKASHADYMDEVPKID